MISQILAVIGVITLIGVFLYCYVTIAEWLNGAIRAVKFVNEHRKHFLFDSDKVELINKIDLLTKKDPGGTSMACMENVCSSHKCGFYQMSNEVIKVCPRCGDKVLNFFDEDPYKYESPSGDDDNNYMDDED